MGPVLVAVSILLVMSIIIYCWKQRRLWYLAAKIPGPIGLPFFGSTLSMIGGKGHFLNYIRNVTKFFIPTGIVKIWFGNWLFVFISDPKDIEIIFNNSKCLNRQLLKYVFDYAKAGDGLVSLSGKTWFKHRQALSPTFKLGVIKKYIPVIQIKILELVKSWQNQSNEEEIEIDIYDHIMTNNFITVCNTIGGVELDNTDNINNKYLKSIKTLKNMAMKFIIKPWWSVSLMFSSSRLSKILASNGKILIGLPNFVVDEKIIMLRVASFRNKTNNCEKGIGLEEMGHGFLGHLVESMFSDSPLLTEEEIRGNTVSMMFIAIESTAISNSFALSLLSFHSDIQDKAFQEQLRIFGNDKHRPATYEDLQNMTYLDQVIKETLRLYPPAPFIPRVLGEELQINNYLLPSGTVAMVNLFGVHRNPEIFPNPDKFNPENFSPEAKIGRHQCSFVPFGGGPRMCIGAKYATIQMKIVLSTILRNFELHPVGKLENLEKLEVSISLNTVTSMKLKLSVRKYETIEEQ